MPGSFRINFWSPCILSLILLAANIGAPFRTSAWGRVFLESLRQKAAAHSVVRVRTVSPSRASQGFQAVVGLARGGPDEADSGARPHACPVLLPSPTETLSHLPRARPIARPHPVLRC